MYSSGADKLIKKWDIESASLLMTLKGSQYYVPEVKDTTAMLEKFSLMGFSSSLLVRTPQQSNGIKKLGN
jgi:hypothetical protein